MFVCIPECLTFWLPPENEIGGFHSIRRGKERFDGAEWEAGG